MALIPIAQQFHTLTSSVVTTDLGSALANSGREVYTMQDIIDTVGASVGDVTAVISSTNDSYLGITVANSTGPIPEVGLNIIGQTELATAPENEDLLIIHDEGDPKNKKISVQNLLSAVPPGVYEVGAGADSAQLIGDASNTAVGDCSGVLSGHDNTTPGPCSIIGGGSGNEAIGLFNSKTGETYGWQFIGGGCDNCSCGSWDVIGGGEKNFSCYAAGKNGEVGYNTISGGRDNEVCGLESVIGGGRGNEVGHFSDGKDAAGGTVIAGGDGNKHTCGAFGTISGGNHNQVYSHTDLSPLFGVTIAGGAENRICMSANEYGGNFMDSDVIGGGYGNRIEDANYAVIAGGQSNKLCSIAAGCAWESVISGGKGNEICGAGRSVISGGGENIVEGVTENYSVIGGGKGNVQDAGATYSSIIGGCSNTIAGHTNAHVIGSGITTTRADATYVEGLNVGQAIPLGSFADNAAAIASGLTTGDVYRQTTTAGGDLLGIVH